MDWTIAVVGAGLLAAAVLLLIVSVGAERTGNERRRIASKLGAYACGLTGLPALCMGLLFVANGAAS